LQLHDPVQPKSDARALLPARFADAMQRVVRRRGTLMVEKK
jgi:hypothetical protein